MTMFFKALLTLIIVFILTACCLAVPAYFIYNNARSLIIDEISNSAIDIAVAAAAFVENDIDKFAELPAYTFTPPPDDGAQPEPAASEMAFSGAEDITDNSRPASGGVYTGGAYDHSGYEDLLDRSGKDNYEAVSIEDGEEKDAVALSPVNAASSPSQATLSDEYFEEITALLKKVSVETGAADVYIEKKLSESQKGYVYGQSDVPERLFSSDLTEEEIIAFNEGINASSDVLHDKSLGEYLRGYAPIIDPTTKKPAGLMVVEFTLADAVSLLSNVRNIIISSFLVTLFLTTFVVYRLILSRTKYRTRDALTDLGNTRYLEKSLKKAMRQSRNTGNPLALVMIDIDRFKSINDTMGHPVGDEVLKTVSKALTRNVRRSDVCCRCGGDEFIIMLPNTSAVQASRVAERIREGVSGLRFEAGGQPFRVTLSIGIAELHDDMSTEAFRETADRAMYMSKNNGKDRITVECA